MNSDNKIGLMSVTDLEGKTFIIPGYQRGYRWESQQVTELLKDLTSFMKGSSSGFYCLQPLVVKRCTPNLDAFKNDIIKALDNDESVVVDKVSEVLSTSISWEVIDGQQRLTTIYILRRLLAPTENEPFSISYSTRERSETFLKDLQKKTQEEADVNIDYSHMFNAYKAAEGWLQIKEKKEKDIRTCLLNVINNRVKFIWYESVNEKPIDVFTRLNIGKISLTNSELIKAILLNRSNYPEETSASFFSLQMEIAAKWDEIENNLQNEEFWLFLNNSTYSEPTRIDFIFEIIFSKDLYGLKSSMEDYNEVVGNDRYSVFRYFAEATEYYQKDQSVSERLKGIWGKVVSLYNTFVEWFNDKYYYHYAGFLIWEKEETKGDKFNLLRNLYVKWDGSDKVQFRNYLIAEIRKSLGNTKASRLKELHFDKDKGIIKKFLLLHNIQDILENQEVQKDKYELNAFYKFPFHLFKKEVWNVEHIDSATTNELTTPKQRRAWIQAAIYAIEKFKNVDELRDRLHEIIAQKGKDDIPDFEEIHNRVEALFPYEDKLNIPEGGNRNEDNERMHIWNLTLLDEGTNKSYKNSIFSVKRSFIIFKEKGLHCYLNTDGKVVSDNQKAIAFVPSCTKQVFMKYYNPDPTNLLTWGRSDAEAYLKDIQEKVKCFFAPEV